MADASYQPKVYRKQGGNEIVVASGGTLTIETGATISSTGVVISDYYNQTVTANVAAATIAIPGISSIGSSTVGARTYKIPAPTDTYKGYRKLVYCAGSTGGCKLSCTAGTILGSKSVITFGANADGVSIELVGSSSINWSIVGYSTNWTTTVKCT